MAESSIIVSTNWCMVCPSVATIPCSKCKLVLYCGDEHQAHDHQFHSFYCGGTRVELTSARSHMLFNAYVRSTRFNDNVKTMKSATSKGDDNKEDARETKTVKNGRVEALHRCDLCARGDFKDLGTGGYVITEKKQADPVQLAINYFYKWTFVCNRCWNEFSNRRPEDSLIRDHFMAIAWLKQYGFSCFASEVLKKKTQINLPLFGLFV